MEHLPVIFRKESDGSILAVFPTEPESYYGYNMTCYAHVGQHGSCSLEYYHETKPAAPDEYAPLLAELRGIYESSHYGEPVQLDVARHRSGAMHSEFIEKALAMGRR